MARTARFVQGSLAAVLLAAAGCSSGTNEVSGSVSVPDTVIAASSTTTTSAPPSASLPAVVTAYVSVEAHGSSEGIPDRMTLTFGIETRQASVGDVLDSLSSQSRALLAFLDSQGIAAADRSTQSLSVYPTYIYLPDGTQTPTGYQASMQVLVQLDDIARASAVVDGAAATIGDDLRVYGVTWSMSNVEELQALARADGVANARVQAEQLADAAGMEVGAVRSISEAWLYGQPMGEGDFGGGGSGIPFEGGSQTVGVNLTVAFELIEAS